MDKLVKDKECIRCSKMFDCKGKPKGTLCVNLEERRYSDGRKKDVDQKSY